MGKGGFFTFKIIVCLMVYRFFLPLFCFLMVLLYGCAHNNKKNTEEGIYCDLKPIRVALLPTMDCLPYFVADKCGIYSTLGIDVRLDVFEAAMDADTAFANGHVDILVTDIVKTIIMQSKGDSVGVLHNYDVPLFLLTSQTARVYSLKNINEKIVAITRNSWDDMSADCMLESVGLKSEEMNKPQINSLKLRTSMLVNNQYDGAILPEPYATFAESCGAKRLCSTRNFRLKTGVALADDSIIDERKKEMKFFVKAYNLAVDTINNRIASSRNILGFLPVSINLCDSLVRVDAYEHSTELSDTTYQLVYKWAKGRGLVGE